MSVGLETIRLWRKQHKAHSDALKVATRKMEELKNSDSRHSVAIAEKRVSAIQEEISVLERRILKSWEEQEK